MTLRLTQLHHPHYGRRVARVDEPQLIFLTGPVSVYELASMAIRNATTLTEQIDACTSGESVDYESIYVGTSDWKLLPAFDHPDDVNRCMVSGTGLTHRASAQNRQAMHDAGAQATLTDSMKMYQLGEAGGRPAAGQAGVQPEWFYKGIATGEANMAHSLANLEYHHFKYANHRIAGQAHLHFYGADTFSFGENVRLQDGDYMEVRWEGMGRPLGNPLRQSTADAGFFRVTAL